MRILSGMRPTGRFHLGNYLGAARNWVELQNQYECFYFVADYHALTTEPDGHKAEDKVFDLAADLLAVGIDPDRSVLYLQSKVPEVAELTLLLSMVTPLSWVQRVPTFKQMAKQHNGVTIRSEEHTSELQSRVDLVCRLLLEKKKKKITKLTRRRLLAASDTSLAS